MSKGIEKDGDRDGDRDRDRDRDRDGDADRDVDVGRERCEGIHSTNAADTTSKKRTKSKSSAHTHSSGGTSGTESQLDAPHNSIPASKGKSAHTALHTHIEPSSSSSGGGSGSGSGSGKNNHLNPFYEFGRMTADDIRNHRYNSGLEEAEEGSWYVLTNIVI